MVNTDVMTKRNSRGDPYLVGRGEIRRSTKDELKRRHFTRMFSLIKNESWGIEGD